MGWSSREGGSSSTRCSCLRWLSVVWYIYLVTFGGFPWVFICRSSLLGFLVHVTLFRYVNPYNVFFNFYTSSSSRSIKEWARSMRAIRKETLFILNSVVNNDRDAKPMHSECSDVNLRFHVRCSWQSLFEHGGIFPQWVPPCLMENNIVYYFFILLWTTCWAMNFWQRLKKLVTLPVGNGGWSTTRWSTILIKSKSPITSWRSTMWIESKSPISAIGGRSARIWWFEW